MVKDNPDYRALHVLGTIKLLELGKVVEIASPKEFFYLEKMDDGKFRLTVSQGLLGDDLTKFEGLGMVRGGVDVPSPEFGFNVTCGIPDCPGPTVCASLENCRRYL